MAEHSSRYSGAFNAWSTTRLSFPMLRFTLVSCCQSTAPNPPQKSETKKPSPFTTIKKLSWLWGATLPIGYGVVPLIAANLQGPLGLQTAQATAAFSGELGALLLVRFILARDTGYKVEYKFNLSNVGASIVTAAVALTFNIGLTLSTGHSLEEHPLAIQAIDIAPVPCLFLFLASAVIAPINEELMYRGFLLEDLRTYMSSPAAVVVSSAAFAVAHLDAGEKSIQLLIVGVLLGLAATKGNSLSAPTLAHSLYNSALFISAVASGIWPTA